MLGSGCVEVGGELLSRQLRGWLGGSCSYMDVGAGRGSGVRWRYNYRQVDDTITSMVILHMWSDPGKANLGLEPLLSSMRELPSWGRLDLSQLGHLHSLQFPRPSSSQGERPL